MQLKTILTTTELEAIAEGLGARLDGSSEDWQPRKQRNVIRGRFVPGADREKYRRVSASAFTGERNVHALCWHGFLDVFRAIYAQDPEALIITAFETWTSLEDLEARKLEAYRKPAGSSMYPVSFGELCRCEREGLPT